MYKDIHRIEDCIIPALFEGVAFSHIRKDPECAPRYDQMLSILKQTIENCFHDLCREKRLRLYRRLDRVITKIIAYFIKNDFNTRKAFLALAEWTRALLESHAIIIDPKSDYWTMLEDMGEVIIVNGYGEIPNFAKIDESAINHVTSLHELAQSEGYFL